MDLFLLHGALGAGRQFDALAAVLHPHFRIHRLDFEGHGTSSNRGRPFRVLHFAENVVESMDASSIGSAAFFGYSVGGYVELPNATLQVMPDTPHPIEQVNVDALANHLRNFFNPRALAC